MRSTLGCITSLSQQVTLSSTSTVFACKPQLLSPFTAIDNHTAKRSVLIMLCTVHHAVQHGHLSLLDNAMLLLLSLLLYSCSGFMRFAASGCTGKGQPCDVGAQRPLKAEMKKSFDEWAVQALQNGSTTLATRLSVIELVFPKFILAGHQYLVNNPDMLSKAWQQSGLLQPWDLGFHIQARNLFDANKLFPRQIPEGQEPEPDQVGDEEDTDGNPHSRPKSSRQGRPKGSKNKSRTAGSATAAAQGSGAEASASGSAAEASGSAAEASGSAAEASGSAAGVQTRKRGRPKGSKNKPKPGSVATAAVRGKGSGKGRAARPCGQMKRLYSSSEDSAPSSNGDSEDASISCSTSSEHDISADLVSACDSDNSSTDAGEGVDSIATSDEEFDVLDDPEVDASPSYDTDEEA